MYDLHYIEIKFMIEILLNYQKHLAYYGKTDLLIRDSDIYIWVGLGIAYHIGFGPKQTSPEMIFWAIHIAMERYGNLT